MYRFPLTQHNPTQLPFPSYLQRMFQSVHGGGLYSTDHLQDAVEIVQFLEHCVDLQDSGYHGNAFLNVLRLHNTLLQPVRELMEGTRENITNTQYLLVSWCQDTGKSYNLSCSYHDFFRTEESAWRCYGTRSPETVFSARGQPCALEKFSIT